MRALVLLILCCGGATPMPIDAGTLTIEMKPDASVDAGQDAGFVDFTPPDAGKMCSSHNGGCAFNAKCTQLGTNAICACKTGFSGNGVICQDINECANDDGGLCVGTCVNTDGGFLCQ